MLSVEIEDPEWSCIKMGSLVKSVMIFPLGWEEPWLILGSDRRILSIVSQSNTLTLTLTPLVPDLCAVNQKDIRYTFTDPEWMVWVCFGSAVFGFVPLLLVKSSFRRLDLEIVSGTQQEQQSLLQT